MNKKELNNLILNEIFGFGKKKEKPPRDNVEAIRQSIAAMRRGVEGDKLTDEEIESTLRDAGFSVADIKKAKEKPSKDQDKPPSGRPGIISKGSPIRDEKISKAARGDKEILDTLLQIKKTDPKRLQRYAKFVEKPDMRLQRFEKAIDAKRKETLNFTSQIQTFTKIRNKLHSVEEVERLKTNAKLNKDYDFYNMLEVYKQLFLDDQSPKAAEPKEEPSPKALPPGETRKELPPGSSPKQLPPGSSPKQLPPGSSPKQLPPGSSPKQLPPGEDTGGGDTPSPKRAKKKGELKPVSGELKPVSGELKPVNTDIEEVPQKQKQKEVPEKQKQKGTSLRLDPKRLSDERYVKEFAKLVADYVMLSPQSEPERERQKSKILDIKMQLNKLMRQGDEEQAQGAIDLQKAIRGEFQPLQRRMQQIVESYVKNNFEQIIREELENYIKEKK